MPNNTQVATEVSVGTKIAVAVLLLAGLGALGYASGFVKLDYQSSQALSNAAAEQCDCLWQCAQDRKTCIDSGRPIEECNGDLGACVDSCEPKDSSLEKPEDEFKGSTIEQTSSKDRCKDDYDACLANGGTQQECGDKAAACLCKEDPTFAPEGYNNTCVDQCRNDRGACEAALAADPSLNLDCPAREQGCLNECDLWCDDFKGSGTDNPKDGEDPNDSSTQGDQCVSACTADYDQCQRDAQNNPGLDCEGRRDGCLLECGGSDQGGPGEPPEGDQPGTTPDNGTVDGGDAGVSAGGEFNPDGDL